MRGAVVVGVGRDDHSTAALAWARNAARTRGCPLVQAHVWGEPVALTMTGDSDGGDGATSYAAVPGRSLTALLTLRPEVLVLGARPAPQHLSRGARACVHAAPCPVVVVPDRPAPPLGRVVVGVTNSWHAAAAVRWAATEAALREAELIVVHARQRQDSGAWSLAGTLAPSATFRDVRGAPLDVLLEESLDADLVVIGRRSAAGASRLWHGALGDDLESLAGCPTAIVAAPLPWFTGLNQE